MQGEGLWLTPAKPAGETSAGFLFVIYLVTWAHQIKRRQPPKIDALRMTQERSERRVRYHDPTRKARAGER